MGLGWKHATVVLLYSSTHFLLPPPLPRPIAREGILEIRTSCMEIELGAEERKARKYPREEEEHSNKKEEQSCESAPHHLI